MTALEFYTNPMSRGQICHWMLEELGVEYTTKWLDWGPTGHKSPEYLAINPMGKIPSLVHGDNVVTECAAICMYLADVFPQADLAPKPEEKAAYYRWLLFAAGPVEHAVTSKHMGWSVPDNKTGTVGFGSFDKTIGTLASHFAAGNDFVCGTRFTAADVYVGSAVDWGMRFETIPSNPSFESYASRLRERSAYQRAKQINEEKLAEMKKG